MGDILMNTIGDRIKHIREKKNLSQKEFGSKIGVSQTRIWQIETGVKIPKYETICKIANIFNENSYWILTGHKETQNEDNEENWYELQYLIKSLANIVSYILEVGMAIIQNRDLNSTKIYEYKKQMIDVFYALNNKSLLYTNLLQHMQCEIDPLYYVYYSEVTTNAFKIKEKVFEYLDSNGTKNVHIQVENKSFNDVVQLTDKRIKNMMKG